MIRLSGLAIILAPLLIFNLVFANGISQEQLDNLFKTYKQYLRARRLYGLELNNVKRRQEKSLRPDTADEVIFISEIDVGDESSDMSVELTTNHKELKKAQANAATLLTDLKSKKNQLMGFRKKLTKGTSITNAELDGYLLARLRSESYKVRSGEYRSFARELTNPNRTVDLGSVGNGPAEIVGGQSGVKRALALAKQAFQLYLENFERTLSLEKDIIEKPPGIK